jgi:Co/Zn/Cd efflux system component
MSDTAAPADANPGARPTGYRRALLIAASLNMAMVVIELGAAFYANSLALFADAVDFYEDAMTCLMAVALIGFGYRARAFFGALLALMMIVPSLWIAWKAVEQLLYGVAPVPLPMGLAGLLALAVNLYCAKLLMPHRTGDSAHRSVWLASRADAIANASIVVAAGVTAWTGSIWPDVIVGIGIAAINIQAAILIAIIAAEEWSDGRDADRASTTP